MLFSRQYGSEGPRVVLLHGGPAAPGHMAPVGRGLAGRFRVLEPFQRGSGAEPLTVARHVADLDEIMEPGAALVGSSWGAMLALAYAAQHPERAGPLVLIGCGTFDTAARARMREILEQRLTPETQRRLEALDPDERLFTYDPVEEPDESEPVDARAHQETWEDMLRLQRDGVYPEAFRAIRSPALMLHGAYDPHPGRMIRDSLSLYLPQLEYHEWERCGHYPWREKAVRTEFFRVLLGWLTATMGA
jgi:pimeloyl-ACP methyl ester carboxylesterase